MVINFEKLRKLAVITESGVELGKIIDIDIDVEQHAVKKYYVETKKIILAEVLLISPGQIIKISASKVIVDDNIARQISGSKEKLSFSAASRSSAFSIRGK